MISPPITELCYNSHNGIKLAPIGSSDNDALSEQVKLVSVHAKCMNAILNEIATVFFLPEQVELVSAQSVFNVSIKHFFVCPAAKDKVSGG